MRISKSSIFLILCLYSIKSFAQTDTITLDSSSWRKPITVGYDRKLAISIPIEAEQVTNIFVIKKHKYFPLDSSIKKNGIYPDGKIKKALPQRYFLVKKEGEKNILYINVEDTFMLKPSSSYYFIIYLNKLAPKALSFFDNYFTYDTAGVSTKSKYDTAMRESLKSFSDDMDNIFGRGNLSFGYLQDKDFDTDTAAFHADFTKTLKSKYDSYAALKKQSDQSAKSYTDTLIAKWPNYDPITFKQLLADTLVTKQSVVFLTSKEISLNTSISDLNTAKSQSLLTDIFSGAISLDCIFCDKTSAASDAAKDLTKRQGNIVQSINTLNNLNRALYLVRPRVIPNSINIDTVIKNNNKLIGSLYQMSALLKQIIKSRQAIEAAILENSFTGKRFVVASVLSGNTYLNFETRNKSMLTPDFGIATSAFSKRGKVLDYGIVPYLGFHINFMAVDKDLEFPSYKKNWKQIVSFMVGWSLVSMQNQDSTYRNFFEKSSLLTGFGFRLSNSFRITTGTQWLFNFSADANNNEMRKLKAIPFIGLSLDLNIKQYLNGFVDLLSGIGKTKSKTPSVATTTQNNN